jgi:hypothetical protein
VAFPSVLKTHLASGKAVPRLGQGTWEWERTKDLPAFTREMIALFAESKTQGEKQRSAA